MEGLREHLAQSLDDGGHAMEGYLLDITERSPTGHEEDHNPAAWFAPAITHTHEPDPVEEMIRRITAMARLTIMARNGAIHRRSLET